MASAEIVFDNKLEKADLIKASFLRWIKSGRMWVVLVLCIVLIISAIYVLEQPLVMLVIPAILLYYYLRLILTYRSTKNNDWLVATRLIFTNENIKVSSSFYNEELKWELLAHWQKIGSYYWLSTKSGRGILIPLRNVPEEAVYEFEELLKQHIKGV